MKKASLILFYLLIPHSVVMASVVDYCFSSRTSLSSVRAHLNTVLSPQDEVVENSSSHCLNIVIKNDLKEELYRKWISRKYPIISSDSSATMKSSSINSRTVQEHCRLEVERLTNVDKKTTGVDISKRSGAYERSFKHSGSQRSSLLLGVGRPGSLRVDNDYINVICKSRNASRVFLDISLTGEKSSVSTSVTLNRGQSLDLASIVEDLNNRFRNISLKKGVRVEKIEGKKSYQYYLRIKD